jgi:Zn-dependent metalloprotease
MVFGNGYVSDDLVGHEFTHRVTAWESGLIYTNASGAINESLSDCWGEFIDLTYNSQGDDSAAVRWLVGEDCTGGSGGRLRRMIDPPDSNDPDRLNSPLYQPTSNTGDNGGVHINSGVNNKLCYLLCDGDTFNGQTVHGLGVSRVADLYYEVQTQLLTSGANYHSLGSALRQAALNLGWNSADQNNLYRACLAVEIIGGAASYYVDKTSACLFSTGAQNCGLTTGPWKTLAQGVSGIPVGNTLRIHGANYNEPMTIRKAMTLRNYTGTVILGRP